MAYDYEMFAPAWVQDAIFYQIFPDRYYKSPKYHAKGKFVDWNSKPTRDNIFGGNLAGITDKLSYISDLGINSIYLCPIFKSNSNHRYHTIDYFEIDPVLGSEKDFSKLLKKAHQLNMRIILDGVFNHCSRGFFEFNSLLELGPNSPYVDWFHIKGWPLNAYCGKPNYECWWNFPALPKFNTFNPEVREYLFSVGEYWIKKGIDGWRLDVPNEIDDDSFWQEFRSRIKKINPEAYIVGEIWDNPSRWLKGDQFDGVMNYIFRKAVMKFLFDKNPITIEEFCHQIKEVFSRNQGSVSMNLLGSHDTTRLLSQPNGSIERIKLAYALMFFLPGSPSIYYGDELSIEGGKDPDNRKSVPWEELHKRKKMPLYGFIKEMVKMRQKNLVLRRGSLEIFFEGDNFSIIRELDHQKMILKVFKNNSDWTFEIVA